MSILCVAWFAAGAVALSATPGRAPDQAGRASWYGAAFAGRPTASGELFDPSDLTAAHRTLPFGTIVEVKRPDTDEAVRVRVNDRGPFTKDRIIDVSRGAGEMIGMIDAGTVDVEIRIVECPAGRRCGVGS